MNRVLGLLVLGTVLAVLEAVVIILVVALLLVLAYWFVTRPTQTLMFLGALTLFCLANARPVACITAFVTLGAVAMLAGAVEKGQIRPLLTAGREGS